MLETTGLIVICSIYLKRFSVVLVLETAEEVTSESVNCEMKLM
jgi:hypothetical protein